MKANSLPRRSFQPGRHFQMLDDPRHDPYQVNEKPVEPSVCQDCGAVFHSGRWQWGMPPESAHKVICPACHRIREKQPAGYVSIEGPFAQAHRGELISMISRLESREKAEHPFQRIMSVEEQGDKLLVTTSDVHLARDIGEALDDAYKGELDYRYNKDQYLLRVYWKR